MRIIIILSSLFLICSGSDTYAQEQFEIIKPDVPWESPPGMLHYTFPKAILRSNALFKDSLPLHSFYISRYLESNRQYCAYLAFLKQHHENLAYSKALPDTIFWKKVIQNEIDARYLSGHFLRDPAFANYPVLGISETQVYAYANWKSDRLNEMILIREGILMFVANDTTKDYFNTMSYLVGKPPSSFSEHYLDSLRHLPPKNEILNPHGATRNVRMEDGILFFSYNIPTIQEWKYAVNSSGQSRKEALHKVGRMKRRQSDPKDYFSYLFPYQGKNPDTPLHKQLRELGIIPVQEEVRGDFLLCNIDRTISEWVTDDTYPSDTGLKHRRIRGNSTETNRQLSTLPFAWSQPPVLSGFRLVLPDY